jgi:17beta-estradiol 17-dehydrogenase / very-long-chain 3-oxoacyl-CoA reductase
MYSCCTCLEALACALGLLYLLRWTYLTVKTLLRVIAPGPTVSTYGACWAVVTGSTDGIGKGIALELAARGFNLALISRTLDKLNATAKECQALGVQTRVIQFDFCADSSLEGYEAIARKIGELDVGVLVNNIGIGIPKPWDTVAAHDLIVGNCYPITLLTQVMLPQMEERFTKKGKQSVIINLSSLTALTPLPYTAMYSATKEYDN